MSMSCCAVNVEQSIRDGTPHAKVTDTVSGIATRRKRCKCPPEFRAPPRAGCPQSRARANTGTRGDGVEGQGEAAEGEHLDGVTEDPAAALGEGDLPAVEGEAGVDERHEQRG